MTSTDYRLPRDVVPIDYDVELDASPKRTSFSGRLVLTAKVKTSTASFELNARGVAVANVKARIDGKKGTLAATVRKHPKRETVELRFAKPLPKGKIEVELTFKGKLNPSMHGLYLAKDGAERAIVSQCEATDARGIFPCFDEPDLKATLKWTVRTDKDLVVITNGVAESVTRKKGSSTVVHTFKRTRVIPTYLAAVTIGKYEASKTKRVKGIPCTSWSGIGKANQTAFAQDVTAWVLPWYEDYFGQKYNYQKLDQVAVPGFDAGAMENVGAIFYRQNLLLMDANTSWAAQKRIAEVIAHELAHQWFGNLVTMIWWDDLWLNEAFATWIAYKAMDIWKPEWRMWDDYSESKEGALAADALVNTHPIYSEVKSPAEATELFDVITYEKGCAVLRMAESYLGADTFRAGMRAYQQAFRNKNAAGADLWNKLTEASGQPVDRLMKSWVEQSGFPLVSVDVRKSGNTCTLHLEQQRYFANPDEFNKANDQTWLIPLVIRYSDNGKVKEFRHLMQERVEDIVLPEALNVDWVYPNANSTGFYRVNLDNAALDAVLKQGLTHLTPAERKSLLEDQWALVRAARSDISRFLDVLVAFQGETDHIVVRTLENRLSFLDQRLVRDEEREHLQRFARWLFAPQLDELGWDAKSGEHPARGVRRAAVLRALGDIGRDSGVLSQAKQRRDTEMNDPSSIDPNIAGVVTSLAAIDGDKRELERYVDTYLARKKSGASPDLQSRYLGALGSFEKSEVISRVHELCLNETVPQEQLRTVLTPMLSSRCAQRATWDFLKKNWKKIGPRVGSMGVARLIESTGALPPDCKDDVADFFTKNPVDEAKRALQKALEAMELRRELASRESVALGEWLKTNTAERRRLD